MAKLNMHKNIVCQTLYYIRSDTHEAAPIYSFTGNPLSQSGMGLTFFFLSLSFLLLSIKKLIANLILIKNSYYNPVFSNLIPSVLFLASLCVGFAMLQAH